MVYTLEQSTEQHPITLELVLDSGDWEGLFDQYEVWRSALTEGGPYEELTAPLWTSARLPAGAEDPLSVPFVGKDVWVSNKQLDLLLRDEVAIPILFAGSDPLTLNQVADQITNSGYGRVRAYVTTGNVLVVETLEIGGAARLTVLGGDAAPLLGLPIGEPAFGKDARPPLVQGQEAYQFTDKFGSEDYWYRIRFRNRMQGTVSEFTAPFQIGSGTVVTANNVVVGYLTLGDAEGKPIANRDVLIYRGTTPNLVEGVLIVGRQEKAVTDSEGYAEFRLMRGQPITLAVAGTNVVLSIVPPTDLDIDRFNVFDPAYVQQDDYFKARAPNIPFAARRSL